MRSPFSLNPLIGEGPCVIRIVSVEVFANFYTVRVVLTNGEEGGVDFVAMLGITVSPPGAEVAVDLIAQDSAQLGDLGAGGLFFLRHLIEEAQIVQWIVVVETPTGLEDLHPPDVFQHIEGEIGQVNGRKVDVVGVTARKTIHYQCIQAGIQVLDHLVYLVGGKLCERRTGRKSVHGSAACLLNCRQICLNRIFPMTSHDAILAASTVIHKPLFPMWMTCFT